MLALMRQSSYILLLLSIWSLILVFVGTSELLQLMSSEWSVSLTMLFASFIAGATSLGGGAVAFPVLTKVLEILPHDAMLFSIAIQSVGMTAASVFIYANKIKVQFSLLPITFLGGIFGFTSCYFIVRPLICPSSIKYMFTVFSVLIVVLLLIQVLKNNESGKENSKTRITTPCLFVTGFIGGLITSFIGTGADFVFFTLLSFVYSRDIKSSTAISVIMMTLISVYASVLLSLTTDVFTPEIRSMWLAAIPVVIIGAPLGAYFCKRVNEKITVGIVFILVLAEAVSTFTLVPIVKQTFIFISMIAIVCLFFVLIFKKNRTYWF